MDRLDLITEMLVFAVLCMSIAHVLKSHAEAVREHRLRAQERFERAIAAGNVTDISTRRHG